MAATHLKKAEDIKPGDVVIEPRLILVGGVWANADRLRIVTEVSIQTYAVDLTFADGVTSPWAVGSDLEVIA